MNAIHALIPLGLLAAAVGPALAQPLPPGAAPNTLPGDPEEPTPVVVTPQPERPDQPPPPPPPLVLSGPATIVRLESAPARPTGFAIGLGFGYVIPSQLDTPNITSARLRLASGLTLEPRVTLGHESASQDDGVLETRDSTDAIGLALGVRVPMRTRGKVDLSLLGAGGISVVADDREGDGNDRTFSDVELSWGVALDYWVSSHWNVSFSATNPIVRVSSQKQDLGGDDDFTTTQTTIGAIFDPTLAVMVHLYL